MFYNSLKALQLAVQFERCTKTWKHAKTCTHTRSQKDTIHVFLPAPAEWYVCRGGNKLRVKSRSYKLTKSAFTLQGSLKFDVCALWNKLRHGCRSVSSERSPFSVLSLRFFCFFLSCSNFVVMELIACSLFKCMDDPYHREHFYFISYRYISIDRDLLVFHFSNHRLNDLEVKAFYWKQQKWIFFSLDMSTSKSYNRRKKEEGEDKQNAEKTVTMQTIIIWLSISRHTAVKVSSVQCKNRFFSLALNSSGAAIVLSCA